MEDRSNQENSLRSAAGGGGYTRRQRTLIIVFSCLGTLLDGMNFTLFLLFLAPMALYFGTSLDNIAVIQSLSYIAGIVGGIGFGLIADRRGRRLGMVLTIALFSVATLASAFSPTFAILLVLRIIAGVGIGGESGVAFAYLMESLTGAKARRGGASGLLMSMIAVGALAATFVYVQTASAFGKDAWRVAFIIMGAVGIVALVVRFFMPESRAWSAMKEAQLTVAPQDRPRLATVVRPLLSIRMLKIIIMMTFAFLGAYAAATYGPAYLQTTLKLGPSTVGNLSYIVDVLALAAWLFGGYLADRVGRRRAFLILSAFGTAIYVFFTVSSILSGGSLVSTLLWSSPVVIAYLLLQAGTGYFGVQGVWVAEMFPTEIRSTAQNVAYYVGRGLGAGVLPLVGLTIATSLGSDLRIAIAFGGIGTLGAFVLALFLPETRGVSLTAGSAAEPGSVPAAEPAVSAQA
jgi:SHS family lactate transporter-like MFS transporter